MKRLTLALGLLSPFYLSSAHAFDLYHDTDTELTFDGRIEVRYNTFQDDTHIWDTGSTRWALAVKQAINDELDFIAEGEWGLYLTEDDYDDHPHAEQRLLYAGFDHVRFGKLTGGKLWGVIYDVGWWTDMGRQYGSRAFGVYNYRDWGQTSGAGRADQAVAWRKEFGDWKLGLQYQGRRSDEDLGYGIEADLTNGIGGSLRYLLAEHLETGIAYYQNTYDEVTTGAGVESGDKARLWLTGLKYQTDNAHAAVNLGYSENWEIAENGQFYDALGVQGYTHYHFANGWRPTFNFNWLGDTGERSHGYHRLTYIYGLEYHFTKDKFLVWGEYQDNHGNNWDGLGYRNGEDEWSLGIRYYF
ncbi:porin [Halomonas binhaiensis]|uniref:Porin n=1 Tax=Halomonas binhaiensis TaxID=2562282 RepID=A0A5C1NDZ5_9GAMM|nr:porin [Halomonas binhaiensis]QEM81191.1 porin [Halomonas binhaiensis]